MRRYFKNDINKQAKPINQVKVYDVYFLLQDEDIVFVGRDIKASGGIPEHQKDKEFNRYFSYFVESKEDAERLENEYIKHFLPRYNLVGRLEQELEKIKPKKEAKEVVKKDPPKALKTEPKKEPEYIAVNPPIEVSMSAKLEEKPVRQLKDYPGSFKLKPGFYIKQNIQGIPHIFFNIGDVVVYSRDVSDLYTYNNSIYRPNAQSGFIRDIKIK